jgi:hypothetical protein
MMNKHRSTILIIISILALPAVFALAVAAQSGERIFLPAVYAVTGNGKEPVPTPTPSPTPVPRHFENCVFSTDYNATIGVKTDVLINSSLVLGVDDEIAVFTPDGSICAGMEPWDGKNIAITAWGDDSQTEEIDGLRAGEEMLFRIWDDSANKEIAVENVSYSYGNGIYMPDGIYLIESFTLE